MWILTPQWLDCRWTGTSVFPVRTETATTTISVERDTSRYGPHLIYPSGLRYTMVNPIFPALTIDPPASSFSSGGVGRDSVAFTSEIADIEKSDPNMRGWWTPAVDQDHSPDIFGDEELLGIVSDNGVVIWSFEEELRLAGESPTYRHLRKQRARERAKARRQKV